MTLQWKCHPTAKCRSPCRCPPLYLSEFMLRTACWCSGSAGFSQIVCHSSTTAGTRSLRLLHGSSGYPHTRPWKVQGENGPQWWPEHCENRGQISGGAHKCISLSAVLGERPLGTIIVAQTVHTTQLTTLEPLARCRAVKIFLVCKFPTSRARTL